MNQQKHLKMASNKFDTQFAIHKPKFYQISFKDQNDEIQCMKGTPMQVLNYILNQQL